jgi:hypothetical protein
MAFPSPINLSTVCSAYGVSPQKLSSLAGVVYYTNGDVSTGTTVFLPVNLYPFAGKYISSSGTLADKDNNNQNVIYYGYGTESLTSMSYVMTNGKLTQITLTWNLGSGNRNAGQGTTTNSQVLEIRDNGVAITSVDTANRALTFNVSVPAGHTFTIYIFANVNNSGEQNGMSITANYSVNITGLTSVQ